VSSSKEKWIGKGSSFEWPGADPVATELAVNLFALAGRMGTVSAALCAAHEVPSPTAFNVLTILHGAGEPLPPSTLADRLLVRRPTMTGVIRTLVDHGLVRSAAHPSDGRMSTVELTDRGRGVVDRMRPALHALEREWMGCLTEPQKDALHGILRALLAHEPTIPSAGVEEQR
jgi:DNA-binding MarR family transcriptional regulator